MHQNHSLSDAAAVTVSVVLTVYNDERFVGASIDSILRQTFGDFELIIVDDGSSDTTMEVIRKFNDARIRVLSLGRLGRQKALNAGIRHGHGRYIAIQDSDDIALPDRLATEVSYLDQHPSVVAISAGSRILIDESGSERHRKDAPAFDDAAIRALLPYRNPLFHSSSMYRRSGFEHVNGYDEHIGCLEDWDFWIRLSTVGELVNLPQALQCKRIHADQFFDGSSGVHRTTKGRLARAKILWRSVSVLGAPAHLRARAAWLFVRSRI